VTNTPDASSTPAAASTLQDQPLGLTVHAMPVPDQSSVRAPSTVAGRWKMLAVLLVCAAPVIASYFTYYVVRPEGRRNFGELIDPQRPLPPLATRALDGRAGTLTALKDQWLLISVAGGACDARCEQNLYFQRQLRESLGKEKERLDRVWLVPTTHPCAMPCCRPWLRPRCCAWRPPNSRNGWSPPPASAGRPPLPGRPDRQLDDAFPGRHGCRRRRQGQA
jgi:hypothetical protein